MSLTLAFQRVTTILFFTLNGKQLLKQILPPGKQSSLLIFRTVRRNKKTARGSNRTSGRGRGAVRRGKHASSSEDEDESEDSEEETNRRVRQAARGRATSKTVVR